MISALIYYIFMKRLDDLWRPISILSILFKVCEKAMYYQIKEHLDKYDIIPSCQSSLRKGYTCATALLAITDDTFRAIDASLMVALV